MCFAILCCVSINIWIYGIVVFLDLDKEQKRPIFFKFDMPFSDQTVHSTPQVIFFA